MKATEICQYVKHYIEEDKTRSAIMLNGEWGTGKSFFIERKLIPFLNKNENGNHRCVLISLYGLKDITEVSKAIYFDLRLKKIKKDSEAAQTSSVLAQTVTKGITSFFGIDLDLDDKKLQELYESIDLSGKLIILEDVERTNIPLLTLMGYINNMVEHDATKILLVANESAIIDTKGTIKETKNDKISVSEYTGTTLEYLKVKEKTINDTIYFECDKKSAIKEIMENYSLLHEIITSDVIDDVIDIMMLKNDHNLRSFLFACQKTSDIFNLLKGNSYQREFKKAIFYGIIAFTINLKQNNQISWRGDDFLSIDLGVANYPLFKFCYDYIKFQMIDIEKIPLAQKEFENLRRYDINKSQNDPDIMIINSWYKNSERRVLEAVKSVEIRLDNPDDISYYEYGSLIVHLLEIREVLGNSIEILEEKIIGNLRGKANELNQDLLFHLIIDPEKTELFSEYKTIKAQMIASMNNAEDDLMGWGYKPENAEAIYNYLTNNRATLIYEGRFITGLNPIKFAKMFLAANSEQMHHLRCIMLAIYPHNSASVPTDDEICILSSMFDQLKTERNKTSLDKIEEMHYNYFLEHLSSILKHKHR